MGSSGLITGAFSSDTTLPTPVPINKGGTGQTTAQAAIDALTAVSGASTNEVLTKDGSGNAAWAAASAGVALDEANTWTAIQTFNTFIPCVITELTISSGAVTVNRKAHIIDTEADASSDTLNTIGATTEGNTITFGSVASARDVTIGDNTGDIITAGNFTLDSNQDTFSAQVRSGGGAWLETSRSNNT